MLILTNDASLTLGPNQSVTFNLEILHTGCAECHRINSGAVTLRMQKAIYDIFFKANIGSTTAGDAAQLTMLLNGSPMTETTMVSTTAAVGDVNSVACETGVRTCCCGPKMVPQPEMITIVNNGETTIVVEQPLLKIKRVA